jgi:hypothetical protein
VADCKRIAWPKTSPGWPRRVGRRLLRVQGRIGNLSLAFEREAFGQASLNEIHGSTVGEKLREQLEHLSEVILPLQDRAHRMMIRSLAQLSLTAQR